MLCAGSEAASLGCSVLRRLLQADVAGAAGAIGAAAGATVGATTGVITTFFCTTILLSGTVAGVLEAGAPVTVLAATGTDGACVSAVGGPVKVCDVFFTSAGGSTGGFVTDGLSLKIPAGDGRSDIADEDGPQFEVPVGTSESRKISNPAFSFL